MVFQRFIDRIPLWFRGGLSVWAKRISNIVLMRCSICPKREQSSHPFIYVYMFNICNEHHILKQMHKTQTQQTR